VAGDRFQSKRYMTDPHGVEQQHHFVEVLAVLANPRVVDLLQLVLVLSV
jgi:hypothetical protein